jgi:dTDP-4-dehydrorhamnose 3,5-epimerase
MNAEVLESSISGCFEIIPEIKLDNRGQFVKIINKDFFLSNSFEFEFSEEYYSKSYNGVIRGLHFQVPPYDHIKLVYCIEGSVFDAVVDLRKESSTFGKFETFELDENKGNILYIPAGLAHGFCVTSEKATMVYKTTTLYSAMHDKGILWNSVDIPWPEKTPIISDRDKKFDSLKNFVSPF